MAMTAATFDARVLVRCGWPSTDAPLTQAQRLAIADEEIAGVLWPQLLSKHGDHYVATADHAITAGYSRYRLPPRTFGPIRDVKLIPSGDTGEGISIPEIDLEELGHLGEQVNTRSGYVHFIDGDFVGIYPKPTVTSGTLRILYYRHPSALANQTALVITAVDVVAKDLSFGSDPDALWNAGDLLDVVSAGSAHQTMIEANAIASFPSGTSLRLTSAIDGAGAQVGDYAVLAGFTPIVQLPDHMLSQAIRLVARACLESMGDVAAVVERKAAEERAVHARTITTPRSQAEPRLIITRNSPYRV